MKKYIPFLVIGAAGLFYFLSKGKAAQKLRVYFNDVNFGKSSGFRIPPMFARFRIVNPTNTPLTVETIAGDIFFNKSLLASIQNLTPVTIPARSEILYPIKIETSGFSLLQTAYNFIKNKEKVNISFDGSVNSSGVVFPVKQTILQQ